MPEELVASLDEIVEISKALGGSGVIARVRVETGWKVYASNVSPLRAWFPAPGGKNEDAEKKRAAALAEAKRFAAQHDAPPPRWAIQIRAYRDTAVVRGQPVTWKEDRTWSYPTYTDAYSLLLDNLREVGILSLPWEGWVRLRFQDDPYAVAHNIREEDAEGNLRYKQIALISEIFPDERAAREAAGAATDGAESVPPDAPPGYTRATWERVIPEIRATLQSGKSIAEVASLYGVPPHWVATL